jgi:hypothetical protein
MASHENCIKNTLTKIKTSKWAGTRTEHKNDRKSKNSTKNKNKNNIEQAVIAKFRRYEYV